MLSVTVNILSPSSVSQLACNADVQSSIYSTIILAATGVTIASAGSEGACVHAASLRRELAARQAQSLPTSCSAATLARTSFSLLIIVPPGGDAAAAQAAIASASYGSATAALATATGCSATSFYVTAAASASCGTADADTLCSLPTTSPAPTNVGAIIGGVIGGAAVLALFIAAVLIARGNCPCCGCACARRSPAVLEAMALPEKVAIAA